MTPLRPSLLRQYQRRLAPAILLIAALAVVGGWLSTRLNDAGALLFGLLLLLSLSAGVMLYASRLLRSLVLDPLVLLRQKGREVSENYFELSGNEALAPEFAEVLDGLAAAAATIAHERQALADNIRSLDETNRQLTEARDAMIRADRLASVGRLSSGIAHEIGNPLGAILGYTGILRRRLNGDELQLVESAEREGHRIDRIVRGLLDYARPREAMEQTVDLCAVIRDTMELVGTQSRVAHAAIRQELPPEPLHAKGDPFQLQQVLVNLIVNAADALEGVAEPRITVRAVARAAAAPKEHVPSRRRDDPSGVDYSHRRRLAAAPRLPDGDPESASGMVAEIIVSDNGPGIPRDMLDQIFDPFVTTKEPGRGTGLGLAVCTRLVEGMHGHIRADNHADGGAEFRIVLPLLIPES